MNHTQTKPNKKKRTLWLISCAIALTVMAGCGSGDNNDTPVNGGSANPPANTDTNNNGSVTDPDTALPDPEPSEPSDNNGTDADPGTEGNTPTDPVEDKILKAEGEYVGEIDTHSVEINIEGTATVFQVDNEVSKQLADISDDASVIFEYVEKETDAGGEKVKQLWLKSIKQK
ncbi:hypothetical protein [Paenibacillus nasutitermitis]|uniref:Lipoprotein n=1 Tax=Paenibacillus nasutitermitis TaxID=1652958 RepID=A0A916Z654_9BACL|nr:hypothetical protein [Paenibacillus nasutitermitis]GGD76658.1 hypothetical protein GCM10010911_38450 [Paenibacillus nasutitermitis]